MREGISDKAKIEHIADAIQEIESATKGYEFESFSKNHVLRIAIVKWLEIIGEAANHVSENVKIKKSTCGMA